MPSDEDWLKSSAERARENAGLDPHELDCAITLTKPRAYEMYSIFDAVG
jgi:hypothetical protein